MGSEEGIDFGVYTLFSSEDLCTVKLSVKPDQVAL